MIPVGRVTDSNMVPINALGRGFLFKPQQTPANDVVPPTFSEQLQTLTVDATPEVPPPGFFGIRVRRDNQPDAYAIDEKAESELENAILSQKGKPFEEIMPYKMEPSRYHKPIPRLATEILQDDEKMKAFYENAQLLDDKMVELSENFISNDLEHRSWEELQLNKQLIKCLVEKCHYKAPRQVQSAVIQKIHQGKNVVCQAENAAGKTMAYIVPIIDYLITQLSAGLYQRKAFPTPMAIVLVPTRELAIQVTEQFNKVLGGMENAVGRAVFCFGQTDQSASFASCANAEIIVACPGRLGHFLGKNAIRTDCLKMLVFDEIDVFAEDRSFVDQLNDIGSYFKNSIQLLFFSSSLSGDAFVFIDEWTHGDHCSISNDKKFLAAKLQFKFFFVKETVIRSNICAEYIKKHCAALGGGASKAVVFCDTREEAFKMAAMLRNKNFNSEVMSADMNQAHREAIVKKLRKSKNDMVVFTSNVFARGLDIAEVEHVVVLKLDMKQDFFNRCGRTGRLKDGFVHVFVSEMANHNDLVSLDLALKSIGHPTPDEIKHLIRGMKKLVNFATSV